LKPHIGRNCASEALVKLFAKDVDI